MLNGKMFCGIVKDDLMVRTGPENYEEALNKPYSRPMDFSGKPMKGFVFVDPQVYSSTKALSGWIRLGLDYVSKLKK